jgi:hypothetical protein
MKSFAMSELAFPDQRKNILDAPIEAAKPSLREVLFIP